MALEKRLALLSALVMLFSLLLACGPANMLLATRGARWACPARCRSRMAKMALSSAPGRSVPSTP